MKKDCKCADTPKGYAKGGAVVGPEPVKNDILQLVSKYLSEAKQLGNKIELPVLGGVGDLLVGEGDTAFDEYSRGYNPLSGMTLERMIGGPLVNNEDAIKALDAAGALPLLGAPVRGAQAVGKTLMAAPRIFADSMGPQVVSNVVKQKGGNWLAGDVEDALKGLRSDIPEINARNIAAGMRNQDNPALVDMVNSGNAYNQWLDQKLAKYIKNEMATPEDPIRALAERGVLHVDPDALNFNMERGVPFMSDRRSVSPMATAWEGASDIQINPADAGELLYSDTLKDANPWLAKVPPETPVNRMYEPGQAAGSLGFNHLTDELRNIINPQSGLPPELLWKYQDLSKVTVPQAVQRVSDVNAWRAANKAEANKKLANNAATVPFKDYPDADYQWVELKQPTELDADSLTRFASDPRIKKSLGDDPSERGKRLALEDALKYEGDTMGHCVGGYCDDVASGKSRIYSLRNKKTGEPHTTIEVAPPTHGGMSYDELRGVQGDDVDELDWTPKIIQIKGKGNKAPVEKYIPYVQDFVRSGQWSDVGDLGNAGLRRVDQPIYDLEPGYYSEQELIAAMNRTDRAPVKKANGGLVSSAKPRRARLTLEKLCGIN